MRSLRLKIEDRTSVYHTMSRVVGNERLLTWKDKIFMEMQMTKVSLFTGVEVITYAFMDNHFHLLLRVLAKEKEMSDAELVRRGDMLYSAKSVEYRQIHRLLVEDEPKEELEAERFRRERDELRKRLIGRMNDLSMFMKMFKQRVSIGFNGKRKRLGALWSERYKSILIENDPFVIMMKAAYQDLNPTRAGMVKDPRDYLFTGYGSAMAGNKRARAGLMSIGKGEYAQENWEMFQVFYERVLFGKGACREKANQAVLSNERVSEVMKWDEAQLMLGEQLKKKMPHFANGLVMGSREFVEEVYGKYLSVKRDGEKKRNRPVVEVMRLPVLGEGEGGWVRQEGGVVTSLKTNRVRGEGTRRRCET